MLVGSGRRLSESFPKSGPLGRCSRILLESETWVSPEFSLTWKLKATKCGCSVFQLAPSVRRTGESGIGLWPTVAANPAQGTPERFLERKREAVARGSQLGVSLTDLNLLCKATWPTQAHGPATSGCLARTASFVERLLVLSAWLQGFPANYLKHWPSAKTRSKRTAHSLPHSGMPSCPK